MNGTRSVQFDTVGGSRVVRITEKDGRSRRVGKLINVMEFSFSQVDPETGTETRVIDPVFLFNTWASFLAAKQFNERRGEIIPELPALLEGCDFYWDLEFRDGQYSALHSTKELLQAMDDAYRFRQSNQTPALLPTPVYLEQAQDLRAFFQGLQNDAQGLDPFAVHGSTFSAISWAVSTVTGSLEIPYISGGATSAELDGFPLFARTIITNDQDALAVMLYYQSIGIQNVAVLYLRTSFGINYHASLNKYGQKLGVTVRSFAYDEDDNSLQRTLVELRNSGYRYIYAITHDYKMVMPLAYRLGIAGNPEYVWIAAEQIVWADRDFELDRTTEGDIAKALHGAATLQVFWQHNQLFDSAMEQMGLNRTLQEEFIRRHAHPQVFDNYTFPKFVQSGFSTTQFDATMSLGIAACNASLHQHLFTGLQLYDALVHSHFPGVSGSVSFDPKTGTRTPEGVQFSLVNIYLSDTRSDDHFYRFDSHQVAFIRHHNITIQQPYRYNDNTTIAPPELAPVAFHDLNLLPHWAQILGCSCAAVVMLVSIGWGIWTLKRRNSLVVKIAQPFFLCQLCLGTFIWAAGIFPMSLPGSSTVHTFDYFGQRVPDADTKGLDIACMSTIWLLLIGFCITFAAIASKTWRVNQLIAKGVRFRRGEVKVEDAMSPLYVTLFIHVVFLLCITLISPLEYQRVLKNSVDPFGRSLESYGTCTPKDRKFYYFFGTILVTDFLSVLTVTYQAYKARNLPTDMSDAQGLALCMMSILESLLVGSPIILGVHGDPTGFFLVASMLVCLPCLTILLILFVPKYQNRDSNPSVLAMVHAFSCRASGSGYYSSAPQFSGEMASFTIEPKPTRVLGPSDMAIVRYPMRIPTKNKTHGINPTE